MRAPNRDTASPPQFGRYIVKYTSIAVYGAWSALVGMATIREVSGSAVEAVWPWLIVLAAVLAIAGMFRFRSSHRNGLLVSAIGMLIAVLGAYSITIYVRCVMEGTWERGPTGLLPIIVMVMPFAQLLDITRRTDTEA